MSGSKEVAVIQRTRTLAVVVAVLAVVAAAPATAQDVTITPFLHASLQIERAGFVVQVDPWSAADLSRAKPADLILVTDDPAHHLDLAAIARLRKPDAPVILAANGKGRLATGIVLPNGSATTVGKVRVESIAAYDLTPGDPAHPKGEASGYVVTIDDRRIYIAGVTECVPEVRALRNIDVAIMPMNIPPGRMSPAAAAACVKTLAPKVVYVYHYDQGHVARLGNTNPSAGWLAPGTTVAESLEAFRAALAGTSIDVRLPDWYAPRR
jgi:L-ascorbate metabolism protein UlaG (beta-lactamase superfamily)